MEGGLRGGYCSCLRLREWALLEGKEGKGPCVVVACFEEGVWRRIGKGRDE